VGRLAKPSGLGRTYGAADALGEMITVKTTNFVGSTQVRIVIPTKGRVERQDGLENWQKCQWPSPRASGKMGLLAMPRFALPKTVVRIARDVAGASIDPVRWGDARVWLENVGKQGEGSLLFFECEDMQQRVEDRCLRRPL
jgi:hypothetical protein